MTTPITLASVVEGHSEVQAVPLLIRRIAIEVYGVDGLVVTTPHRVTRSQMVAGDTLRRAVQMQSVRAGCRGGVLVVADADDCPVELAGRLRALVGRQPSKLTVAVAVREFESWFLAAVRSLAGHGAIRPDADYPKDPEIRRDAKGALSNLMTTTYRETLHRPAFAQLMDLEAGMRSKSFSHLVSSVGYLLEAGSPD